MGPKWSVLLFVSFLSVLTGVQRVAADDGNNSDLNWVQMHGWLLWASWGFLFPLGAILIRYTRPQGDLLSNPSVQRVWVLFYLHVFIMSLGIVLSTVGVAILFVKLGVNLDYTHPRLGLAIMILGWMQPFIGVVRPQRGTAARPYWFALHWLIGTGGVFLGIINCFLGTRVYEFINRLSIRSLNIAFSIQISVFALLYLLQDRWGYIVGQSKIRKAAPQSTSL